jgi:type I restriction enzyme S subunit
MNVIIGSLGRSRYTGCLSPVYYVLQRRDTKNDPRYLELVFQHKSFQQSLIRIGNGILAHRMRIPMEKLKAEMFPLPPPDEQAAIVRFLNWANGRLDRAIRAKRKVIALLNEQKQAIIHRAVTRGLATSVPLKPSGISWLGDIPKHWIVQRAKYLYREIDERSTHGSEELLSVSHLTGVTPRSQKNITMFKAASYAGHKLCRPGDLVVNTMWAWMGALGVSTHAGIISPAYAVYRPRRPEDIVGLYMDGLLRSRPYVSNIICRSTGLRGLRDFVYIQRSSSGSQSSSLRLKSSSRS